MGNSTSCFKVITCGGDSAEQDDAVDVPQNKRSSDKKGWSFRKRSERHRVLSSTVIHEATTPGGLKESQASAGFEFQQPDVLVATEKTSTVQYTEDKPQVITSKEHIDEKPQSVELKEYAEEKPQSLTLIELAEEKSQLLSPINSTGEKSQLLTPEEPKVPVPVTATTDEAEDDSNVDESVVVIIQTAIRGFLARKELRKLKNLVKLQAAVRGHLVRRHAVGSLRCVQAIVKMQLLVRAHLSQEGSCAEKKLDGKNQEGNKKVGSSAMENLLSNRFARQLMDSTPKTKPINIKCDSSKSNSAWSWLERWMSVSSSEKTSKAELPIEQPEQRKTDDCDSPITAADPSDAKPDERETLVSSESEENLITYDATNIKFEACQPTSSSVTDDLDEPQVDIVSASDLKESSQEINSQGQTMQIDAHSQIESEQPKMDGFVSEQLETEAKKFVFGFKKASNPAFVAAQTRFEELSSTANSSRSIDSSYKDVRVEPNLDTLSSGADTISRPKEPSITENPVLNHWRVQHSSSECGTELSITSTLDSPDRSEVGTLEYENGAKVSEQENCSSNGTKDLDIKENDTVAIPVSDSSPSVADQPEKLDDSKGESANFIVVHSPQVDREPQKSKSNPQKVLDSMKNETYKSPEASRSHMAVPEFQGTPSSEVSVKAKKKKSDKSSQKRKSMSAAKGSPSTPAASSIEQLPKDQKSGKRRNSFSSTRPEDIDEEPRNSNSSNSLPRFMQATEAARAKVNANNSPRSSPDVQDRDSYIKKRHSLPGANGRQGSPRIQRSLSQAQPGAKGNERRWQR